MGTGRRSATGGDGPARAGGAHRRQAQRLGGDRRLAPARDAPQGTTSRRATRCRPGAGDRHRPRWPDHRGRPAPSRRRRGGRCPDRGDGRPGAPDQDVAHPEGDRRQPGEVVAGDPPRHHVRRGRCPVAARRQGCRRQAPARGPAHRPSRAAAAAVPRLQRRRRGRRDRPPPALRRRVRRRHARRAAGGGRPRSGRDERGSAGGRDRAAGHRRPGAQGEARRAARPDVHRLQHRGGRRTLRHPARPIRNHGDPVGGSGRSEPLWCATARSSWDGRCRSACPTTTAPSTARPGRAFMAAVVEALEA